jgi:cell division protein FtsQ
VALAVPRKRTRAAAGSRPTRASIRALLPSARVLLIAWFVAIAAGGAYALARQTAIFDVQTISVDGAPPALAAKVRQAAATAMGRSLVSLDGAAVVARVEGLPPIASATYDRAFPHTLRITVRPERPIAILRAGSHGWIVATSGRVLQRVLLGTHRNLPRIWIPATSDVTVGSVLDPQSGRDAARVLAPLHDRHLPRRVVAVTYAGGDLTFALAGGIELRFGRAEALRLKLAIARRILPRLDSTAAYLDVSVPERPVAGADEAQVSG